MGTVTVEQLRRDLPDVLKRLSTGGPLTVTQDGRAVAELRPPIQGPPKPRREPGSCKGLFKLPDDFNDPLPDDILDSFENGPIFP